MRHNAELMVAVELLIGAIKALVILVLVLNLTAVLLWFERKGAALIQDRIGANRMRPSPGLRRATISCSA